MTYKVLKQFDLYRPGDIMKAADVADQERRGNLPDLLANEDIVPVALEDMTVADLREMAAEVGVKYWGLKKAELIEALS